MFCAVYLVQHVSGVRRRQTEARSGLCDGRGREAHHHHADFPLQHLSRKSPWKSRCKQHHYEASFTGVCARLQRRKRSNLKGLLRSQQAFFVAKLHEIHSRVIGFSVTFLCCLRSFAPVYFVEHDGDYLTGNPIKRRTVQQSFPHSSLVKLKISNIQRPTCCIWT